jgi:phosphoribosylamine--glycine ligase
MKVLVVGSGGREHALVWKLSQSPLVREIFAAPGNPGTATLGRNVPIGALEIDRLVEFARSEGIGLTVVGPDDALAQGVVDAMQAAGLRAFGPTQAAARFESSKSFAKAFMQRHGIPTAQSETFTDPVAALAYAASARYPLVVKADGLALGKGVIIAATREEATEAIRQMMERRVFGAAGDRVVLEEFLQGVECSIHALIDGRSWQWFPDCQDHKRIGEGNTGPNTGGMGTISPSGVVDAQLRERIEREVLDRFVAGLQAEGIDFRGLLFPGLMLTPSGPKVLEFNCRFGDPETQVLMRRLQSDLVELLLATLEQKLPETQPRWSQDAAACIILASGGYPGSYEKGHPITGLEAASGQSGVVVFQAGTAANPAGELVTAGGRVLGVTATGPDLPAARQAAYNAVAQIHFAGKTLRRDIGGPILPE